jgi:methyl-accepting chemotaxis protein
MGALWFRVLVPAAPALLTLSYLHLRWRRNIVRDWTAWAVTLGLALAPLGIAFAWQSDFIYGIVYAACVYVGVVAFFLRGINRITPLAVSAALLVAGAAVIIVVPTAILPRLHLDLKADSSGDDSFAELDVSFIEKSVNSMKSSMDSTTSSIEAEKRNMAAAIEKLSAGLAQRNRQLKDMNERHQLLKQEVEQYKSLANLTGEQADAVRAALQNGKYLDYFVGFVLGIVSSITASFMSRLLHKR